MPVVRSNGLDLYYETVGDSADPAVLLIMGLGSQLIDWPDEFGQALAARGYHVIRFDNRDIGKSSWLDELGLPDVPGLFGGDLSTVGYRLTDLAADTAGLLTALGVPRAHVVGASMGGMIAQQLCIEHPELVASLASIMSTTGNPAVGHNTLDNPAGLMPVPGQGREAAIAAAANVYRAISSPGFEVSDAELTRRATASVDRAYHPAGTARQFAAIAASADRTEALHTLTLPTVVIHGEADPLINVTGGRATAEAIPGAELLVIPGMGHDLPRAAWDQIINAITSNAAKA